MPVQELVDCTQHRVSDAPIQQDIRPQSDDASQKLRGARAEKAERQVERLTRELQAVQAQLADPTIYEGDGGKVAELAGQEGRLKKLLEEAEEAWLEAQEALETAE